MYRISNTVPSAVATGFSKGRSESAQQLNGRGLNGDPLALRSLSRIPPPCSSHSFTVTYLHSSNKRYCCSSHIKGGLRTFSPPSSCAPSCVLPASKHNSHNNETGANSFLIFALRTSPSCSSKMIRNEKEEAARKNRIEGDYQEPEYITITITDPVPPFSHSILSPLQPLPHR